MTAPAFPLSQLGRPSVDYTLKPADLRVRTYTYSGLAQSYNASNAGLTTISVKWEWGAAQYAIFQSWFRNECKDGSIEFTINDLYINNSLTTITARFTEPPKASYSAWMHFSVSATLETRTNDYVTEAILDAALSSGPITANPTWPTALFGRPSSDGASEEAQSSSLRGKTSGYARPAMRRKSPVTVTNMPIKWNMSQANKILFDAWYHYKLVDGAGWFWLFTDFHGELNYMIKVRFVESISLKYSSVDWWEISGTVETVEYNYLPLADCPTLVAPTLVAPTNIDTLLPIITDQPDDVTQDTGTTVTLSVTATTETGTLAYQWYFGSVALVGATSASYSFTLSDTTDGGYHVVVSNDVGHVTSRTASVAILLLPDNVIANFSYDTNVTETSGYVTSWKDATGNFEFLGSASYVYGPQKVIGALYFANSQLITAASLKASTGPITQFTLIYVYKSASMTGVITGATLLTCGNQDSGNQNYIELVTETSKATWGLQFIGYNAGTVSIDTTIPQVDSSYRIIFVTYDNGVVNCYDGNILAGTITCPATFNTIDVSLGVIAGREWSENTYNHPDLYVKEFDLYDRVLTSDERSSAIEYLKYRYNI